MGQVPEQRTVTDRRPFATICPVGLTRQGLRNRC